MVKHHTIKRVEQILLVTISFKWL